MLFSHLCVPSVCFCNPICFSPNFEEQQCGTRHGVNLKDTNGLTEMRSSQVTYVTLASGTFSRIFSPHRTWCCIGTWFHAQRTCSAPVEEICQRVVMFCRVFHEDCHGTRAVCNRIDAREQKIFASMQSALRQTGLSLVIELSCCVVFPNSATCCAWARCGNREVSCRCCLGSFLIAWVRRM